MVLWRAARVYGEPSSDACGCDDTDVRQVWNATNDPLFGWISDKWRSDTVAFLCSCLSLSVLFLLNWSAQDWNRTSAIRYGGALWVVAFVSTWIEWGTGWLAGVHFVVMLCFYDGMLTYVEETP